MWKSFALAVAAALGLTFAAGVLMSGEREHEEHDEHEKGAYQRMSGNRMLRGRDVAPADHAGYREQCGACHFAYPAGLLPAASWQQLMTSLDDHFGDNAELSAEVTTELTDYLTAHAADSEAAVGRSVAFARSSEGVPLRISETAYFRREHRELPRWAVQENAEVGSFSRCDACHTRADAGSFNEHDVVIPGFGRWED